MDQALYINGIKVLNNADVDFTTSMSYSDLSSPTVVKTQ